jgi:O-antigen ligase
MIYVIFVVSLIVSLLISGPFLPDLIVSLSSLVFLVYVFKNKLFIYFTRKPLIIFFIYCIYCIYCILVSIFAAKDKMLSFESSFIYFRIWVFTCLIWYLIDQNKKILIYFYYTLVACFSLLVVDGYVQFFTGTNISGITKSGVRLSSFFGDELILRSYLSRLFPLLVALFLLKEKKQLELYLVSALIIFLSGLIYSSGERAAFFLFILSCMFMIIFVEKFAKLKIILTVCSLLLIAVITLNFSSV